MKRVPRVMKRVLSYLKTHKHRLATVALVFGFLVDLVTFRSINLPLALTLLSAHLGIVAFTALITSMPFRERETFTSKVRAWLPVLGQYSTGNLLSAFLILYSASGSLAHSWPFYALLAASAIGNETLRQKRYRVPFQTSLLFLNLILFSALLFPILFNSISTATFLVALAFAAALFIGFRRLMRIAAKSVYNENRTRITFGAVVVASAVVLFYFTNLIPPIPLSLKDIAFYHEVVRAGDTYIARDEERSFFNRYVSSSGTILRLADRERAYAYTAVFAPAKLNTQVVHRWQYWDESRGSWVTRHSMDFPITGGRHGGYRGFSFTENPAPGRWRLSVETTDGRIIGRAYLVVKRSPGTVPTEVSEIR